MNTTKSKFLEAVRILALDDSFILNLAQCVNEEDLPLFPGSAALLFVTEISKLCVPTQQSPVAMGDSLAEARRAGRGAFRGLLRNRSCRRMAPAAAQVPRHICSK